MILAQDDDFLDVVIFNAIEQGLFAFGQERDVVDFSDCAGDLYRMDHAHVFHVDDV